MRNNQKSSFLLSPLRQRLLSEVIIGNSTDILSLQRVTGKSRSTIRDNLIVLEKKHYIKESVTQSWNEKSKRIYKPTEKAIHYAVGFLNAEFDEYVDQASPKDSNNHDSQSKVPASKRKQLMKMTSKMMIMYDFFDIYGNRLNNELLIERAAQIGFGLAPLPKFSEQMSSIDENFNKIFTTEEQKIFRPYGDKIGRNGENTSRQIRRISANSAAESTKRDWKGEVKG